MKVPIPFFGLVMKTIETDLVQKFLGVFRQPQDIHRVLIVIPIALFISHTVFLKNQPGTSVVFNNLQRPEMIWVGLMGFLLFFVSCWAVFSSGFNFVLYVRQSVFVMWTCLLHRLSYGLEVFGTPYLTGISIIALISFLPFAFTGFRPDQLYKQYKDDKALTAHPAIITRTEEAA